jgi:hypothetical protein
VLRETAADPAEVVTRAYHLALGRGPDGHETELALAFLREETGLVRQRLRNKRAVALAEAAPGQVDPALGGAVVELCHVLMNLNEFAYIE